MKKPELYLGDITKGYQYDVGSPNARIEIHNDFWRDIDTGELLMFRKQRQLDTVSNAPPGSSSTKPGFFGKRIGAANKEYALRLASGRVDAHTFDFNVLYAMSADMAERAVDLRRFAGVPPKLVALHGLSATIGPVLGTRQFDTHPALEGRPIITTRPLTQRVFAPDLGISAENQPAAFIHTPFDQRTALRALAYRSKSQRMQ